MFAAIFLHSGLFAPPPTIVLFFTLIPSDFATSSESLSPKITPSSTACVISLRLVSIVMPTKVPLASGSFNGLRSPMR